MIIAGTGHRPNKLGGYNDIVYANLIDLARWHLAIKQPLEVISGMALGWDQALAQAALDLGIPLTVAVPFIGFESRWPSSSQRTYNKLRKNASKTHVVSNYPGVVSLQLRNEWMVDNCDEIAALWDGSWGGTFNCLRYAEKKRLPIVNLWDVWALGF